MYNVNFTYNDTIELFKDEYDYFKFGSKISFIIKNKKKYSLHDLFMLIDIINEISMLRFGFKVFNNDYSPRLYKEQLI